MKNSQYDYRVELDETKTMGSPPSSKSGLFKKEFDFGTGRRFAFPTDPELVSVTFAALKVFVGTTQIQLCLLDFERDVSRTRNLMYDNLAPARVALLSFARWVPTAFVALVPHFHFVPVQKSKGIGVIYNPPIVPSSSSR